MRQLSMLVCESIAEFKNGPGMKSLSETLVLFREDVVGATVGAPHDCADWDTGGYKAHRADLLDRWSEIEPRIKGDLDKVIVIDQQLNDALTSFSRGEREPGQSLMVLTCPLPAIPT
jgi:hypothetical protein